MVHPTLQVLFLKSEADACIAYLKIANSAYGQSHRQQALGDALLAYTTVQEHLPDAPLSEEERRWFDD